MTDFIRVGIAAAAATVMTFGAQAADMRAPVYKGPPPVVVQSWTGCYLGGQLGAQWDRFNATVNYPSVPAITASREFEGDAAFIYGGQVGCNWQSPGSMFVVGVEADLIGRSKGDHGGEIVRFIAPATDHFDASGHYGTQSSVRLRLGAAFDRMLIYVAGGASWARISATHSLIRDGGPSLVFDASSTRSGWNIGVGAEYLIAGNWTMGLEYRYTDYGSLDFNVPAGTNGALAWIAHSGSLDDLRTQDIRFRLNYLFGGPGASSVRARY